MSAYAGPRAEIRIGPVHLWHPEHTLAVTDLPERATLPEARDRQLLALGIDRVRVADGLTETDLAERAALGALADTGTDPADLDGLLLVQGRAPEYLMASEATRLQHRIGATRALTLGVGDLGCVSSSAAIEIGAALLRGRGGPGRVLVAMGVRAAATARYRPPMTVLGDCGAAFLLTTGGDDSGGGSYTSGGDTGGGAPYINGSGGPYTSGSSAYTPGGAPDTSGSGAYTPGGDTSGGAPRPVGGRAARYRLLGQELRSDGRYADLFRIRYRELPPERWAEECADENAYSFQLAIESRNRLRDLNAELLRRCATPQDELAAVVMQNLSMGAFAFWQDALGVKIADVCRANLAGHGHLGPADVLMNLERLAPSVPAGGKVLVMNSSPVAAWCTALVERLPD
ncbi:3-oxoacyl-ACP synthase [Streptomyces sp. CSDS2]|uniref:3-oxoacyl-ACP synthase n=1 Tax=Streptomyces sp. CSDS2 TaxID=3055051 RepID=UPI0025B026CB|nr:3-oxoacyl-ACP synthase [Streptomyces sp. CSDS2]MDN3260398.1 3-oxoacyl-ACP synthase [Streptomyces sp. CSDS2]